MNKLNANITVIFNGMQNGKLYVIDEENANGPAYIYNLDGSTYEMRRFAVAVLYPS